jgi:hypothetical protein
MLLLLLRGGLDEGDCLSLGIWCVQATIHNILRRTERVQALNKLCHSCRPQPGVPIRGLGRCHGRRTRSGGHAPTVAT